MVAINNTRKIPLSKHVQYFFEACGVYLAYGFFWLMPIDTASDMGGKIMRFLGPRMAASRKAMRNIERAMPETTEEERQKILKDMWENLGRVFAEYPHLDKLYDRIETQGREVFEKIRNTHDRGAILIGAHIANWEVYALGTKINNVPLHLVYRPPNNYFLDGMIHWTRRRAGAISNIPKNVTGTRQMVAALKSHEKIGALIDQKFNSGVAVPFFNMPAMTTPAVVQMGLRFDVPLYPVRIVRTKGCQFKIMIEPALDVPDIDNEDEKTYQMLLDIHKKYESWIREEPGQWLWIHRRWKLKK